jgi:CHAT domain-containing protein/Flp pilus assembly protein TadD
MSSLPGRWRDHRTQCQRLTLAGALLAFAACRSATGDSGTAQRTIDELIAERYTAGRFAQQTAWQRCVPTDTTGLIPRARCGEPLAPGTKQFRRIAELGPELQRSAGRESAPVHLRAEALDELRTATSAIPIKRAIAALERARGLAPHDAKILNDLAVAYLELGQNDQRLESMLRALDAIEQANERDSTAAAMLFNRALILERLYMTASAAHAWSRYLAVEHNAQWRREGDEHLKRLTSRTVGPEWSDLRNPSPEHGGVRASQIASLVERAPQNARDSAFAFLRDWGEAVRSGRRASADTLLGIVRETSRALDSLGFDRSLSLAVEAIEVHASDAASMAAMATAHIDLADGSAFQLRGSLDSALICLTRADSIFRRVGSPAARWTAYWLAATDVEKRRVDEADQILARVLSESTPQEPALRGKAVWSLGVSQLRRGNYEGAIRLYRAARDTLARAREPENNAAISYVLSEALDMAGQSSPGRYEAYTGLKLLAPFRKSNSLNNHVTNVAAFARREGLRYAAVAIMQEVLDVAPGVGRPQVMAWAHRANAREHMMLGQLGNAREALDSASRWIDSIPAGEIHDRVRGDVALVSAQLTRREDPRGARSTLTDVVTEFAKSARNHLAEALYEKSIADTAAGDYSSARQALDSAIRVVDRQSRSFSTAEVRATFSETVENLFDGMIDLQLAAHHGDSAFAYLERGRQAVWSGGTPRAGASASAPTPELDRIRALLPSDMLLVEYAVLPTHVVIWTASKDRWSSHVDEIPRDTIAALVDQAINETMSGSAESANASARLYDRLIRGLSIDPRTIKKLVIIPDRELARLPFAALRDTTHRAYLVERFELRTSPSAAFLMAALDRRGRRSVVGHALVVGDPTLDASGARLPTLAGALREAQQVADAYPSHHLLTRGAARRDSVLALLPTSSVFHFAGHAIINSDQPELSYLALASTGGGTVDDGILRAREIGTLLPSNLQLAVLSACSTLNPRPSHTGAIAGLAYSFLRAGVPATISTLWDVSDEAVASLLVDFHRRLVGGTPAAEALRSAQLAAMSQSTPRAWAAFIYTGP